MIVPVLVAAADRYLQPDSARRRRRGNVTLEDKKSLEALSLVAIEKQLKTIMINLGV